MASVLRDPNKRTFRFKPAHDVMLLKEIGRQRPWTAAHGETMSSWEAIGAAFNAQLGLVRPGGPDIDPKACQRRYKALVDAYLSGDLASLRSTGTPDEVAEREHLIAELHQTAKEYRSDRVERRQSRTGGDGLPVDSGVGHDGVTGLADMGLPALVPASIPPTNATAAPAEGHTYGNRRPLEHNGSPSVKRPRTLGSRQSEEAAVAWEFIQQFLQEERNQRQQELRVAEQRLELEKQRFELEKRERENNIAMMNGQLELIKQLSRQFQQR